MNRNQRRRGKCLGDPKGQWPFNSEVPTHCLPSSTGKSKRPGATSWGMRAAIQCANADLCAANRMGPHQSWGSKQSTIGGLSRMAGGDKRQKEIRPLSQEGRGLRKIQFQADKNLLKNRGQGTRRGLQSGTVGQALH